MNSFIAEYGIKSVIEFGCGGANQLKLASYRKYLGFDISHKAISICRKVFASDDTKSFKLLNEYNGEKAELVLSLDVIYHLIEDDVFQSHMNMLFKASTHFVVIYSSNFEVNPSFPKDLVPEMIAFFNLSCEAGRTSDHMCFYEAVE